MFSATLASVALGFPCCISMKVTRSVVIHTRLKLPKPFLQPQIHARTKTDKTIFVFVRVIVLCHSLCYSLCSCLRLSLCHCLCGCFYLCHFFLIVFVVVLVFVIVFMFVIVLGNMCGGLVCA